MAHVCLHIEYNIEVEEEIMVNWSLVLIFIVVMF